MTETATRALTGAAYVALTLGAALAGPLTTTLLFLPVSLLAAREMHRLSHATKEETPPVTIPLLVTAATFLTIAFLGRPALPASSAVVLLLAFTVGVVDIVPNNAKEMSRGRHPGDHDRLSPCPFGSQFAATDGHLFIGSDHP
jgi:hypothetical protein